MLLALLTWYQQHAHIILPLFALCLGMLYLKYWQMVHEDRLIAQGAKFGALTGARVWHTWRIGQEEQVSPYLAVQRVQVWRYSCN